MKKLFLGFLLVCFFMVLTFGDDNGEEVGFLLFQPNLGNAFVNDEQASVQLDLIAQNIIERNLGSGQINIHGYAAVADNDIDPNKLSEERALFILNELQKRGISRGSFSVPEGHGAVTLFGINEEDLMPNRRVIVLVQPVVVPPVATVTSVTIVPGTTTVPQGSTQQFNATVTGTNNPPQTVTWSVTGGGAGTSISPTGLLTVGSNQSPGSITVTAASTADTTKTGTANVTVDLSRSGTNQEKPKININWKTVAIIAGIVILVALAVFIGIRLFGVSGGMRGPTIPRAPRASGGGQSPSLSSIKTYHGGKHGDLATGEGIERHHMPSWNAFPKEMKDMKRDEMPAIQMAKEDHAKTIGFRGGDNALDELYDKYIKKGNYMGAVKVSIKNVRNIAKEQGFPKKYDVAIKEFLVEAKKYNKKVFQPYYKEIKKILT
jgi:hypothetical protein